MAVSYEAPIKFAVLSNSQNMVYIKLKGNGNIKTGFLTTLKFLNKYCQKYNQQRSASRKNSSDHQF